MTEAPEYLVHCLLWQAARWFCLTAGRDARVFFQRGTPTRTRLESRAIGHCFLSHPSRSRLRSISSGRVSFCFVASVSSPSVYPNRRCELLGAQMFVEFPARIVNFGATFADS